MFDIIKFSVNNKFFSFTISLKKVGRSGISRRLAIFYAKRKKKAIKAKEYWHCSWSHGGVGRWDAAEVKWTGRCDA
jgi:hypothetical protein